MDVFKHSSSSADHNKNPKNSKKPLWTNAMTITLPVITRMAGSLLWAPSPHDQAKVKGFELEM